MSLNMYISNRNSFLLQHLPQDFSKWLSMDNQKKILQSKNTHRGKCSKMGKRIKLVAKYYHFKDTTMVDFSKLANLLIGIMYELILLFSQSQILWTRVLIRFLINLSNESHTYYIWDFLQCLVKHKLQGICLTKRAQRKINMKNMIEYISSTKT